MPTVYPETIRRLQGVLVEYRAKRLSVGDLQSAIWSTAQALESREDRELRKFLQWAEGKLDTLQFTTEAPELFTASLEIVAAIENRVQEVLRA